MRSVRLFPSRLLLGAITLVSVASLGAGCGGDGDDSYRDDYYDRDRGGDSIDYDDRDRRDYYDDDRYRDGDRDERDRYDRDRYDDRDRDQDHDRDRDDRDAGIRVPREAKVVANGNKGLVFKPDRPGTVYVRDERSGKVIYSGRVRAGQELRVAADAKGRRVSLDGKTVLGDLAAEPREREVLFRADRGSSAGPRTRDDDDVRRIDGKTGGDEVRY